MPVAMHAASLTWHSEMGWLIAGLDVQHLLPRRCPPRLQPDCDRQELSLLAGGGSELRQNTVSISDVAALKNERLLKTVVIYGANASGKSNLIRAFANCRDVIALSAKESLAQDDLPISPFALNAQSTKRPTTFTARFVLGGVLYEYGVGLTQYRLESESLIAYPKRLPQQLFHRSWTPDGTPQWRFSRTHFRRDKQLEERTRANSLYAAAGRLRRCWIGDINALQS